MCVYDLSLIEVKGQLGKVQMVFILGVSGQDN